jgi:predicted trehalose synthase
MDHFMSIDRQLQGMREHFESERKSLMDQLFVARTEAQLANEQLQRAVEARAHAERMTVRLLTQFATVALVFDEARHVAEDTGLLQPNVKPEVAKAVEQGLLEKLGELSGER